MRYFFLLIATAFFSAPTKAQTAKDVIETYTGRNALGIKVGVASLNMVIKDRKGRIKERQLDLKVYEDQVERASLVLVKNPAELRGTSLLFREIIKSEQAQMHLYLPRSGRPRRIAEGQKKSPFVSSDFTFGDLDGSYLKGANLERKKDTEMAGQTCFHIVAIPEKSRSKASRVELFIRKDSYLAEVIKYYDRKDKVYKIFKLVKAEKRKGQWLATQSQMWNKGKGSITAVALESLTEASNLKLDMFTPERMNIE